MRRGFQDLLEAEVSAAIGATRHERCPDERSTHRNGYRQRLLTTQVGDISLAIPKVRQATATRKPKGYKALGYREVLGIAVGAPAYLIVAVNHGTTFSSRPDIAPAWCAVWQLTACPVITLGGA